VKGQSRAGQPGDCSQRCECSTEGERELHEPRDLVRVSQHDREHPAETYATGPVESGEGRTRQAPRLRIDDGADDEKWDLLSDGRHRNPGALRIDSDCAARLEQGSLFFCTADGVPAV
jgi:hypothetical protein